LGAVVFVNERTFAGIVRNQDIFSAVVFDQTVKTRHASFKTNKSKRKAVRISD